MQGHTFECIHPIGFLPMRVCLHTHKTGALSRIYPVTAKKSRNVKPDIYGSSSLRVKGNDVIIYTRCLVHTIVCTFGIQ